MRWRKRVIETQPDGNKRTTYLNFAGEPILTIDQNVTTGQEWKGKSEGSGLVDSHNSGKHPGLGLKKKLK